MILENKKEVGFVDTCRDTEEEIRIVGIRNALLKSMGFKILEIVDAKDYSIVDID